MDFVPYTAQQLHMYRQHELQQQEKLQQQQQQQNLLQQRQQQSRKFQPQQQFRQKYRFPHQGGQISPLIQRQFFQTHRQFPRPRGLGRLGQHRVVISPVLTDTDSYDFYPAGSVNVRGEPSGFPLNNNDSNNNNNNIKAAADATTSTQLLQACGISAPAGASRQNVTHKGGVQTPEADYDNVVTAVPRLSRVLEEESVLGGGEFEAENTSEDVARVDGIMKDETSRREGKGVDVGKVGVGRGEKNTCSDIASPHAAVPSGDEPDSALLEKSHTGGEREEASRNGLGSDGEGGDGGEQCPRTGDENNVSTDCRCTRSEGISSAQDSRENRVIGDNANGSSGGGGDGGDGGRNNTGEECSSVCHPLNNASEQLEEKTLIVVSGSGSNGTNFQVDKNDKINISRENAAADSVLTVENSCGNSSITTSVNVSNGSESTGEDGENNLISSGNILNLNHPDRIRINSSLDETKINESNGFLAEEEDKTCESESRDSEKEETSVLEMGNQNSASRIGSSSSNSQPQNFNAQSRKDKKSPSSRVDAVHFKKDSSESADSDGGSISIVSEPRKPEDSNCTTEVGGSDTTDVEKQVVLVAAGEEQTSDSKAEPTLVSKTAHSSCSTKEVDETEKFLAPKCHLKEGERMSNGSFSSCSSSSGQYQLCSGPIDQSKCLPEILKSTESVGKVSSSERLSLMSESVEVNLPSVPAVSKTATMIVSTPSTASPHNAAVTTATITAATMAATAATNTAPAVPATTAATVTQLGQVARAIKLGPKTEEIYAVPLPRSMRATSNAQICPEQEKEQDEDGATSEPPPLPKRLFEGAEPTIPASDIESKEIKGESHNVSVSQDTDEILRQMRLQNTVQVTCQMKKSHTACGGLSHVTSSRDSTSDYTGFRGYYYNSSGDGPSYDYFSLGRKPKRQPRIKTLTDSKGMALSLDKLLKLRRQSASTTSTNGSTHLSGEPSVEDIMRTCSEYDMNFSSCNAYRDRTCSDAAATQSPLDLPARTRGPLLSFTQASQITIPDDWEGFGSNTIGGRRHGNVKALVRGAKKHRASARDGKSKNGLGVTVQKSDSVRSAPPASDDRRLEQKPHLQASANDYLPTYTEISRLPTYTEAGVKLAEARSGGLTKKSKLSVSEHHSNPSSASLSSLGSQSSRKSESDKTKNKLCSETHSISSQNSRSKHTADAEPSSLKRDKLSTGSNTLPRASGREHAREASFASSSSSHSSSASTVTIVAADQISQVTESHFISLASPASQSDNTQPASASKLVDSGQIHSSCDNIGSDKDKTAVAPAATVNVVKYGPISSSSIAIKPASGSRPKNGMDLSPPRNISASNSQHTAELNKSKDSNRTQSTSSSSSKYKFPPQGKSSVSTDSGSSMDGTTGGSYSGSLKRKQDKVESKKSSDKKTYTLKWLKPTDKGSKNKTQKDTSFRKAMSADQGQTRVSATSDQDSRSSSLTTSGSFTSDPRSPLTSGGSLDDHRSPVFSPLSPAGSAEMSCLTVDTSSSFSHSKERGRISPLFAAPRSPNHSSKLEAGEALKWLRAAGFPQYAQMFEDGLFPLELSYVEKDHDFLDADSLQSLFRRLETLNKYAGMKLDSHPRKKTASEEEDEEDFCALSERWEYQKSVRRWSRKDLQTPSSPGSLSAGASKGGDSKGFNIASEDAVDGRKTSHTTQRAPSHDSLLADQEDTGQSETGEKSGYLDVAETQGRVEDVHDHTLQNDDEDNQNDRHTSSSSSASSTLSPRLRRAASERIKTAKSLWRKMEGGLKSRKSRRHNGGATGGALEISDPVLADKGGDMKARLERLQCVDIKQEDSGQSGVVTADALSSRLAATSSAEQSTSDSLDAVSKATHQTSVVTATTSQSTPGSGGEPLPQPAFRSRPSESEPSVSISQSESQSETEKPPAPDARLTEYYSAQSQFQHNLRQAQQKTSASDGLGNLMEIFLVPQDHQPGRFPTALQNGYIEKDPHLSAASTRVRDLGESKRLDEIRNQEGVQSQHPALRGARGMGANRTSVYDNFGPPSTQPSGSRLLNSRFSPIDEDDKKSASVPRGSRALSADNAADASSETLIGVKNRSVSFDSASEWAVRSVEAATTDDRVRSRSISFESNPELEKKAGQAVTDSDSLSCRTDACSEPLPSKGVSHSVSADSYFQDPAPSTSMSDAGSVSSNTSQDDGSSCSSSTVHYSNYEEFEAILKQLYENISDLTSVIDWDDDDPTLSSMDTKPTPSQSATTALHVDTPSHALTSRGNDLRLRPEPGHDPNIDLDLDLDSPLSPTSDPLALSPAASRGEGATDESLDLDQHENSSSSSAGDGGSHTADSGSDDAEALIADLSHDDSLDTIPAVTRERRDSGVGHSLTRAPSDRRRKKIRWHSFQRSHRPDVTCRAQQVNALTVGQLVRLQKLALLKLTGIMEKCLPVNKSGWNWMMPRFMKRHKAPDFSDRTVFGVPLSVMVQRTGQPLPQCVLYAMRYLRRTSQNSIGIFRKSGVRSKILQLRDHLEAHPDTTDFEGMNAYNVADMLKTFFRDLPECLLTNKMSETFRSIYTHVPSSQRLEAIQAAILLLPDENREVLQSILLFLSDISSHQAEHQMNASNLAVCFTPTVFQLGRSGSGSPASPKRGRKLGGSNSHSPGTPDPREIMEQKAAHECLHMLIMECKHLFTVPPHLFRQLQVISLAHEEPGPLHDLGTSTEEVRAFGQERIQFVLKEAHDRKGHWTSMPSVGDVDVYSRKPIDDYPLKEWKLVVEIEAPPIEVLRRIMHERHAWDEDLLSWSVVERLDPHSDIFQYALNTMAPHPSRHYCVLRYWRSDLTKGSCALVTMSVEHSDAASIQGVWAIDLGSYFLMEPCGAGRSRLIYLTRVDTRGRTPEWYTKMYGHIQANFLERLKDSFKQETSGPETKV